MKKKQKKKNLRIVYLSGALLVVVILAIGFGVWVFNGNGDSKFVPFEVDSRTDLIASTEVANSHAIGWIRVQGTNIDYPVIYETPQAFGSGIDYTWTTHRPNPTENRMSIYGHNILNVSNQPIITDSTHTRFEQLMSFVYYDFAENNLYLQYSHDDQNDVYLIYAIGFVGSEEEGKVTKSSSETAKYIEEAQANSLYKYDVDVNENDTLLSLVTCTRYFGLDGKTQFRVDARKVRDSEKIEKYKVEKTANYDIIK